MGDVSITTTMDTRQFVEQLETASRQVVNALRRSVDRTARAARKEAVARMPPDIGTPKRDFARGIGPVKASTQSNISASWTTTQSRTPALKVAEFTPVLSALRGSADVSTYRLTGGPSSHLNLPKAFVMRASNGAELLMVRKGGKIHPIYAASPKTLMGEDNAVAHTTWEKVAERELQANVATEMQKALDGASLSIEPIPQSE
jgi:hypothetical protein